MTLISTSFHWLISGTCVWWCEGFRRSTVKLLQVQCWVSSERIRKRGRNSFPSSGDERNLISNTIFLKICVLYIPMYAGLKRILLSHLDYIRVLVFCQGMVSLRPFLLSLSCIAYEVYLSMSFSFKVYNTLRLCLDNFKIPWNA